MFLKNLSWKSTLHLLWKMGTWDNTHHKLCANTNHRVNSSLVLVSYDLVNISFSQSTQCHFRQRCYYNDALKNALKTDKQFLLVNLRLLECCFIIQYDSSVNSKFKSNYMETITFVSFTYSGYGQGQAESAPLSSLLPREVHIDLCLPYKTGEVDAGKRLDPSFPLVVSPNGCSCIIIWSLNS